MTQNSRPSMEPISRSPCGRVFSRAATAARRSASAVRLVAGPYDAAGRRWVSNSDHPRPQKCPQHNARVGRDAQNTARNRSAGTQAPDPVLGRLSATDDTPAPMATAESPGEAAELLDALLAVPSEEWSALAEAMSQELFDRLKRWRAVRLAEDRAQVASRGR